MAGQGDRLASGRQTSATFPSNSHIPQDKWDAAFKDVKETTPKKKKRKANAPASAETADRP